MKKALASSAQRKKDCAAQSKEFPFPELKAKQPKNGQVCCP